MTKESDETMKKRQRSSLLLSGILGAGTLLLTAGLIFGVWDPVEQSSRAFGQSVKKLAYQKKNGDVVFLSELTPFEWDRVYSFPPYTSKDEMEWILGFSSPEITETVNEGMVQLIFVSQPAGEDPIVTACITGYPENLGYNVELGHLLNGPDYMWIGQGTDPLVFRMENGIPSLHYEGYSFDGTIETLYDNNTALVYIDEDEDLRLSGEEIVVSLPEEMMERAEEDRKVRVFYKGYVQETSPLGLDGQLDIKFLD